MDIKRLMDMPSWEWPEGTDKVLIGFLRDGNADLSDRLAAAELAGDLTVIDDDLADGLLYVVKNDNEPEQLRSTAAIALGPVLEYTYDEIDMADEQTISPRTFNRIQDSLQSLFMNADVPKEVRRRILEASVRASRDWHRDAIRTAFASSDEDWKLTAIFCMGFIDGFDDQILEALKSRNPEIYYEAVCAAGDWGLDGAWEHIVSIIAGRDADKPLLLAAIEASVNIRPQEAPGLLRGLLSSGDEDIVEAVHEAISMAEMIADDEFPDEDDETLH